MDEYIVRIACIGDSITYGLNIEDPDEDSYPNQLQMLLTDQYLVNPNLGRSGAAIWRSSPLPYNSTIQFKDAKDWVADIQVVCLGSNDTVNQINDSFKEQFIEDYLTLLSDLKKNSPTAKTFVCEIPPIFGADNVVFAERVPEINNLITEVANRFGATVIDLNTPFDSREDLFFSDGLHPNEAGAGLIAETVYNAIKLELK